MNKLLAIFLGTTILAATSSLADEVNNWNNDTTFGSLQVTMGMQTGKFFGGDSQIFIKPGVLAGGDRPADWSMQVGFRVIGF